MKYIVFFVAVISLLVFNCTDISPNQFLIAGFLTFLIPIAIVLNLIFFVWLFFKKSYFCIVPLIILVFGFKFVAGTFAINFPGDELGANTFSVLSYNTTFFKRSDFKDDPNPQTDPESDSYKMVKWIQDNGADIKCFQEYYHRDSIDMFNTLDLIAESGEYDYYFSSKHMGQKNGEVGIAIFSRFPIVNSGEVIFKQGSVNRAAFADITIHGDTIRFINVHLQSMSLSPYNPLASKSLSDTKQNLRTVYEKFAKGLLDRSFQAEVIKELIYQSPYKVILVGDFNQTPYSFVYNSFKEIMHNAFEKAGSGFGFTYGGSTLFFLRIDNQFYDPGLKALDFQTHRDVPYSDHYPIEGKYGLGHD